MLTPNEKTVGRAFRDKVEAELEQSFVDNPPTYVVPSVLALYRHGCPKRKDRSTALELKEIYVKSPHNSELDVPAGRFGFIYREGKCRLCGHTARSRRGRLVDGLARPPIHGRVVRG